MTLPSSGPLSLSDIQGEFGGSNPIGLNEYYAGGGLVPAGTTGTYGAVPTSGQISVQNFYGTSNFVPVYIEELFSTWLYPGSSAQTITNGINLSGSGGLVWIKGRNGSLSHALIDTVRGGTFVLSSDLSSAQANYAPQGITSFNSNGFTLGTALTINNASYNYASWTFRKQPKFFDIVSYTGNGATRTIPHNLGSVPGCIIVKRTNTTSEWQVYHRTLPATDYMRLNSVTTSAWGADRWNSTAPTASVFSLGFSDEVNANGSSYIAYLFAHNAGGFGLTGSDNVISCGSFNSTSFVNLGYEPQWMLLKRTDGFEGWFLIDNMRGWTASGNYTFFYANAASPESSSAGINLDTTGFTPSFNTAGGNYIYVAIRRGPMKVPTSGTSVFSPVTYTGNASSPRSITGSNFPVDLVINDNRNGTNTMVVDRLRGLNQLQTTTTNAESSSANGIDGLAQMDGVTIGANLNFGTAPYINWYFRRAPGFFDEVCWTGDGAATKAVVHKLGVTPQLIICKSRTATNDADWYTYHANASNTLIINGTNTSGWGPSSLWYPTINTFTADRNNIGLNASGKEYVTYLFATLAGVSKVGGYTGTGALQTINCGFTGGVRFVLIKRTDSAGDWYVYDSARGISSGNDPYLFLNSTAAEVTGTNYVDTTSVGFQVTAAAPAGLNANGGTYIFFAIA
jgi:hypothetical protein